MHSQASLLLKANSVLDKLKVPSCELFKIGLKSKNIFALGSRQHYPYSLKLWIAYFPAVSRQIISLGEIGPSVRSAGKNRSSNVSYRARNLTFFPSMHLCAAGEMRKEVGHKMINRLTQGDAEFFCHTK